MRYYGANATELNARSLPKLSAVRIRAAWAALSIIVASVSWGTSGSLAAEQSWLQRGGWDFGEIKPNPNWEECCDGGVLLALGRFIADPNQDLHGKHLNASGKCGDSPDCCSRRIRGHARGYAHKKIVGTIDVIEAEHSRLFELNMLVSDDEITEPASIEIGLFFELLEIVPTTVASVVALVTYLDEVNKKDPWKFEDNHATPLIGNLAEAFNRIAAAS
jgi:hypothetical protein